MTELLAPISGSERFMLLQLSVVMVTSMLIPIVIVALSQWRKVREREAAAGLVHDMLSRGLSTDEIERVLVRSGLSMSSQNAHGHDS